MKDFSNENIIELINSDYVTDATGGVLLERLNACEMPPRFFDQREFEILKAVCAALAPSPTVPEWFVANAIDKRLADDSGGNGWRYAAMPTDGESYKIGLRFLNESARENFQMDFARLEIEQRTSILKRCSSGDDKERTEQSKFAPARFLEELCAEFAEIFYSHPLAQAEIGYIGFADARGWDLEANSEQFKVQSRSEIPDSKSQIPNSAIGTTNPKSKIQNLKFDAVDAVIIGTGAGGAPILARLAQAGLKVVALEAGKSFDYTKFATDEREQSNLFWTDERLSAGENAVAFGSNNSGCGVGGSTLHYTAYTPRPQADDFRLFSEFGVGRDWCMPFEDLEPYFDELEWFLGVSGAASYP